MVAILVIATVLAIAIPNYVKMTENARIVVAIGDIRQISSDIGVYFLTNGLFPASLGDIGFGWKRDPWGSPYQFLVISGAGKKTGQFRKDKNLHPLNSDYDLYSLGRDGKSAPPINAKISEDDIIRANNGGFIGTAKNY
jgi:general secretion pathway protein G